MTMTTVGRAARQIALPVNEVFGLVPQGEGPYSGWAATFVRFGQGCNLSCPPCDTKQTWDRSAFDLAAESPLTLTADIVRRAVEHGAGEGDMTVVSGGEPLLWQRSGAWGAFLGAMPGALHMETNGTIAPTPATVDRFAHFTVSPKTGRMGAGDPVKKRIRPDVLAAFARLAVDDQAVFKFVAATPDDVDEVAAIVQAHRLPRRKVWVMPLGAGHDEARDAGRRIVDRVMAHRFKITGRLHLELGVR